MSEGISEDAQFEILGRLAQALVDGVGPQIAETGTFMPLGGLLVAGPQVQLVNVKPQEGQGEITPDMIMPAVHHSIQTLAKKIPTEAVATCTPAVIDLGEGDVAAVKIVAEHRAGLAAAFHVPWTRTEGGGVQMHAADAEEVDGEVEGWR